MAMAEFVPVIFLQKTLFIGSLQGNVTSPLIPLECEEQGANASCTRRVYHLSAPCGRGLVRVPF